VLPPRLPNAVGVEYIDTIVNYLNRKNGHNNKPILNSDDVMMDDDSLDVDSHINDHEGIEKLSNQCDHDLSSNTSRNWNDSSDSSDQISIIHAVAADPFIFTNHELIPILPSHRRRLNHNESC